jgi:Tfp pilus assembly protein PilF
MVLAMKSFRSIVLPMLVCAGLAACCAVIYGQTLRHGFLSYDDGLYVFENLHVQAGLTWNSVCWAFTTSMANYVHPLTWMSHMLDCELYGLLPWGHHLTSLVIHAINAMLLFLVLVRMTGRHWPSAFAAALFAVHPLHVETVAWIAERKGLLSMLFWTAAMGGYAWHARRPNPVRYLSVAVLFLLGLLSKPSTVTLPFVLLLLDFWPLERMDRMASIRAMARRTVWLAVEKIPLFVLTALICTTTFVMQWRGNNLVFGERIPFTARCANALVVYVVYLVKTVCPWDLAVYYPHPLVRPAGHVAGAVVMLAAVTLLCLCQFRRRPYLIVGWLWYLGTLVPVIQLVQIGTFSHADRYTYIPLIGIFVMVAWSLDEVRSVSRTRSVAVTAAAVIAVAALGAMAFRQTAYWKDDPTLFGHDLAVAGENPVAHDDIGTALMDLKKPVEAAEQFKLALKADPHNAEALYNLGVVMEALNRPAEAESWYRQTLQWKPSYPKAHNNLGGLLVQSRRFDEAMGHFRAAIASDPDLVDAHNNLGSLLALQGKLDEAMQEYGKALELDPGQISVRLNLASILAHLGRPEEALQQLGKVLQREPGNKLAQQMAAQVEAARANRTGTGAKAP